MNAAAYSSNTKNRMSRMTPLARSAVHDRNREKNGELYDYLLSKGDSEGLRLLRRSIFMVNAVDYVRAERKDQKRNSSPENISNKAKSKVAGNLAS